MVILANRKDLPGSHDGGGAILIANKEIESISQSYYQELVNGNNVDIPSPTKEMVKIIISEHRASHVLPQYC